MTALVAAVLLSLGGRAVASPYVTLNSQADWQAALDDGRITEVSTPYPALEAHYGVLGTNFIQVTPELMALSDAQSGMGDGLLMDWGNAASDLPQVATWQYNYPEDPNLMGTLLKLTVTAPPGITSVSLTLNDALGGWISWDWNVTPQGGPGPIFQGIAYQIVIDPTLPLNQSNSTSFALAGFNPTQATTIQADELAVGANQWNVFPGRPITNDKRPWNYWSDFEVQPIPEPSALIIWSVAGLGAAGWTAWRRRR